jgi:hypothetical protein
MGVVWRAHDERLRRTVVVKQVLLPPRLSDSEVDEANRRAMREGRITARLHHPHAIAVYDVVEHKGQPCLIMECLASRSLATVLSTQGVLPPEKVASIGGHIEVTCIVRHSVLVREVLRSMYRRAPATAGNKPSPLLALAERCRAMG